MAIEWTEKRSSGTQTGDYSDQASVVEEFIVRDTDGNNITQADVLDSPEFPSYGTRYNQTSAVFRRYELTAEPSNRSVWYATLYYETANDTVQIGLQDPVSRPATVMYNLRIQQQVMDFAYDINDERGEMTKPVVNTAGDSFDPAMTDERSFLVVIVEKNYRDFDPGDIAKYQNTVNENRVTVGGVEFAEETAWMSVIQHRLMFDKSGNQYDRMRFEIVKNDDGWSKKGLSQGYRSLDIPRNKQVPILNIEINDSLTEEQGAFLPVSYPVGLDTDGQSTNDPASIAKLEFMFKWKENWSSLNLPRRKDGRS